jgi:tetratricopeptide (TPR) repeat protein
MTRVCETPVRCRHIRIRLLAPLVAAFIPLFAAPLHGQCPPLAIAKKEAGPVRLEGIQKPSTKTFETGKPEFSDEPHFTVAGVTDTTNLGGHGSDVVVRNREALAQQAASLGEDSAEPVATADYERARTKIRDLLAKEDKAELHHQLADLDEKLGNPLEAAHEYQRAAEMTPSEAYLFDWGAELLAHRAAEPASEVFAKGNRLFPKSARMLAGLAVAWYARGSYDDAVRCLCQAADLNPNDANAYLFLGKIQGLEHTQIEGVSERLGRFARLEPENPLANYYYAVSLWKQRRGPEDTSNLVEIESLLQKAVRLDPALDVAYMQLGIQYSERRDFSKAITFYEKAAAINPQMEEAHYRLALAYRETGDKAKRERELSLYEDAARQHAQEVERQRHEIQQFVYKLKDQPSTSQPN